MYCLVLSRYTCTCVAGYDGYNCQNDINECQTDPCSDPGTNSCTHQINARTCTCNAGYEGKDFHFKESFVKNILSAAAIP